MRKPALLCVAIGFTLLLVAGCGFGDPVGPGDPYSQRPTERDVVFSAVSGNNQTGVAGQELPVSLVARLTDNYGNPRRGHMVEWVIVAGDGAMRAVYTVTDADGVTGNRWKLGPEPGTNAVELRSITRLGGDERMHGTFIAAGTPPD